MRRLLVLIALLVGATLAYHWTGLGPRLASGDLAGTREEILAFGWRGVAFYVAVYAAFVALGLPNLPFQLAAGAIYGVWKAYAMMYVGANLGALGAFVLARSLGRKGIERLWGGRLAALNRSIESGGFHVLLILRLLPLMPFNAINYAAGISRLPLRDYVSANLMGLIPLTFVHVAFGHGVGRLDLRHPAALIRSVKSDPGIYVPLLGALAILAVALALGRRLRNRSRKTRRG